MFERHAIASDLLSPGNNQKTIEPCPSDEGLIPAGDRMALPTAWRVGALVRWRVGVLACWRVGMLAAGVNPLSLGDG